MEGVHVVLVAVLGGEALRGGGMVKLFSSSRANSQIQPSQVERLTEPFMAALMPLVPEASRVTTGVLSHM
jgi:hypothetical protein